MKEKRLSNLLFALATVIRSRRKALNISQEDLATKAHLHRTYLSDVERDHKNLSIAAVYHLAIALDTTASLLIAEAETLAAS